MNNFEQLFYLIFIDNFIKIMFNFEYLFTINKFAIDK